jgi:hypothetical protein
MRQLIRARRMSGGLVAAGGLCALVAGLALIEERVPQQIARVFATRAPTPELSSGGRFLHELTVIVLQAVRDQTIEHAPLVIFGLAAVILVLLMTRT